MLKKRARTPDAALQQIAAIWNRKYESSLSNSPASHFGSQFAAIRDDLHSEARFVSYLIYLVNLY